MKKSNQVALIAIAKDEAPYLHEWIHHHLYMGFSPIFIGINRTTDESILILDKIAKKYPQVIFKEIDWIDQNCKDNLAKNIQSLGYSYLTDLCKGNFDDVSSVMYLDIDEYWFSLKNISIQEHLASVKNSDIHSFFWLCQEVEETPFSPPFTDVHFTYNRHVKSLISMEASKSISLFRAHIPRFNYYENLTHIDSNGNDFVCEVNHQGINGQFSRLGGDSLKKQSAYILHRMIRSENEYLSTVFRGNPEGEKIKRNRNGIKFAGAKPLEFELPSEYYISLKNFINQCEIDLDLVQAKEERRVSYINVFESMTIQDLNQEFPNALKTLSSSQLFETYLDRLMTENTNSDILKNLAVACGKSTYLDIANQLMKRTYELRPNGSFIQQKFAEYKEKLASKIRKVN